MRSILRSLMKIIEIDHKHIFKHLEVVLLLLYIHYSLDAMCDMSDIKLLNYF